MRKCTTQKDNSKRSCAGSGSGREVVHGAYIHSFLFSDEHDCFAARAQPKPRPKKRLHTENTPGPGGVELFFQRDRGVRPCDDGLETITTTPNEHDTDSNASLLKPAQPSRTKRHTREYLINIHCLTDVLLSSIGLGSSKNA